MKLNKKMLILTGAALLGYRAVTGHGAFNRIRYKKVYDAICDYSAAHYPNSKIGEIYPSKEGYCSVINLGKSQIILYVIPTENGEFIFSEL